MNSNPTQPESSQGAKPETPSDLKYRQNEDQEGRPTLVSINEDDVTVKPSEINDDSTGMGEDDYLGRSKDRKE